MTIRHMEIRYERKGRSVVADGSSHGTARHMYGELCRVEFTVNIIHTMLLTYHTIPYHTIMESINYTPLHRSIQGQPFLFMELCQGMCDSVHELSLYTHTLTRTHTLTIHVCLTKHSQQTRVLPSRGTRPGLSSTRSRSALVSDQAGIR